MFVGGDLTCKVSGFHFAQSVEGGFCQTPAETKFAIKWMAPETTVQKRFAIKSDVWFGVVKLSHTVMSLNPGWTNALILKRLSHAPACR